MTYTQFLAAVHNGGWSTAELRGDIPPSHTLLAFMDAVGLEDYETYVMRYLGNG